MFESWIAHNELNLDRAGDGCGHSRRPDNDEVPCSSASIAHRF